eukprot:m.18018 g.18018  ORF g.18018 m.18018 type:complete len:134 (-) comp4878_c0_seq1:64-465(-)
MKRTKLSMNLSTKMTKRKAKDVQVSITNPQPHLHQDRRMIEEVGKGEMIAKVGIGEMDVEVGIGEMIERQMNTSEENMETGAHVIIVLAQGHAHHHVAGNTKEVIDIKIESNEQFPFTTTSFFQLYQSPPPQF